MCDFHEAANTAASADGFYLDHPTHRRFIERVNEIRATQDDPHAIVAAVRPAFEELLADPDWLSPNFMASVATSGMGSGIGMWLLYKAPDDSLAFSSLVVPPGAQTPVHDHLAWGIVGLYRGTQDEDVFIRRDDGADEHVAVLELAEAKRLTPGDLYELLPENDIHRVRTTSETASVSLHLLGNNNGCIWRHQFSPEEQAVKPFKSGWLNVPCDEEGAME
jgi:predicted metal-dependent enzyme (double-stranded beta helix superfamily)